MNILPIILSICAGVCLYVSILHLLIGWQRLQPALHICFGLCSLLVCSYILGMIAMYQATNIEDYIYARKWVSGTGFILAVCLTWFAAIYTNFKPVRLILVLNSLYLFYFLINLISPAGIPYSYISQLSNFSLPWGELITYPEGTTINPFIRFQSLSLIILAIFMFYACYRQYLRSERQAAINLTVSVYILLGMCVHDRLIDLGIFKSVYLAQFGFMSFVLIMSISLTRELFQAVKLRQQLLESERLRKIAVEEERNRLARDLHDSVSQTLFSVATIAETVPRVWQRHPEIAQEKLEELAQLTQGALAEMRSLLVELRPSGLRDKSLGELLKQLTKAVQGRAKIQIITTVTGDQPLPEEVKLVFYRVTQEALNNIIKHAQSTQVDVTFQGNSEYIKLCISDNGYGFDVKDIPLGHLGIEIMKERAESISANFQLESYLGKGTKIILTWLVNQW
ncbi:sensor histidine kinase [Anabaena sp. UHCC 0187]|uniref:sensor histidine kinase n=1 Tax=Anabaena sp. UHCC 0187 TaxID=2590018 RepID=UPI001448919D|nr:sensor histidine kinase [Anabaena sp. UHCC 0187]MTJ12367.1 sensor histidine kinase [Anabaena sp. UHCC 0187]